MTMSKLEILQDIVTNGYRKVKWTSKVTGKNHTLLIDTSTANAILAVYNALSEENKTKYINCSWQQMADFAWKHVSFKS